MNFHLDYIANVLIIAGLWYQGSKLWWAFLFSVLGEALWIWYAASIHLWSLVIVCAIFGGLAARNLLMWRKADARS